MHVPKYVCIYCTKWKWICTPVEYWWSVCPSLPSRVAWHSCGVHCRWELPRQSGEEWDCSWSSGVWLFVCACVLAHVCVRTHVCIRVHTWVSACVYIYVCVCMCVCMYVCMCVCVCVHVYTSICKSMYIYMCTCVVSTLCWVTGMWYLVYFLSLSDSYTHTCAQPCLTYTKWIARDCYILIILPARWQS